ncbi:MAG: RIP metalloprotease [Acidimicrobiia bacterium]|nr:RIP metalloprotease [Acidimicrobiia bacterium]
MKDPLEEASAEVDRRGATFILVAIVAGLVGLAIFRPGSRDALALIVGIVLMVMLHEAGHFIAAKRTGMKATEFFVGFGPRLWSFKRGETEFGVKAILLGGYVRILGMTNIEDVDPADESRTYRRASHKNRLIVVLAGVTVNVILALVLFWAFFAVQGHTNEGVATTTIDHVVASVRNSDGEKIPSPAKAAGFHHGDRIVAIDGKRVTGWEDLVAKIEARGDQATEFTVVRKGERTQLDATPKDKQGRGFLGIGPAAAFRSINPLQAVPESFNALGDITAGTVSGMAHLFSPDGLSEYSKNFSSDAPKAGTPEADARPRSLIGIVDAGSDIVSGDWAQLLWLLGAISLILAIFNTLPLLPFDGGHAAVVVYEAIASKVKKREVRADFRKLMPLTAVVLAAFLMLGLSAMFLDIRDAIN